MYKVVSDYIPLDVVKNPYYFSQKFYKYLSHKVLQIYERSETNHNKYPFSLFSQKFVDIILEVNNVLIGLNHNPKLGWTFPVKHTVKNIDTRKVYYIDGKFAIYVRHNADKMVYLFAEDKKQRAIPSSEILSLKRAGRYRECTALEKLEILYDM
jgi:hypothetical protein